MARIADSARPNLDWDAIGDAIDRPATEARSSGKTVEDIPAPIRAHVEHSFSRNVVRVIPINPKHGNADGMAKEIVRLAKLFGDLRTPKLTVAATVVKDYHVPGQSAPIPLAVTILARNKITRTRKPTGNPDTTPSAVTPPSANGQAPGKVAPTSSTKRK